MNFADDLKCSIAFCTRLPVGSEPAEAGAFMRASWAWPLVGVAVGAAAALVYAIAAALGLAGLPGAALALATSLALTGCLHEDGLADTADGFGGGRDRAGKLDIMRDSRIGSYGAAALALSLMLRWSALAALVAPAAVAAALIASHAAARAAMPAFMHVVPTARRDGLAADAGRPSLEIVTMAGAIGVVVLGLALGPLTGTLALVLVAMAAALVAWLTLRQIGGHTGDVLGAVEQVSEIVVLLTAVALHGMLP